MIFAMTERDNLLRRAIRGYSEYLQWPVKLIGQREQRPSNDVIVQVIEAKSTDLATMRRIEKYRANRRRFVLLFAPPTEIPMLTSVIADMPEILHLSPENSAIEFTQKLEALIKECEDNKSFHLAYNSAEKDYLNKKSEPALAKATQLLKSKVDVFSSQMLLGRIHFGSSTYDKALISAKGALASRPKSLSAVSLVAAIYQKLGQSPKAQKLMEDFLPVAESNIDYLIQLGDVYFENSDIEKSQKIYSKAKSIDTTNTKADEGLLAVNLLQGNLKASADFTKNNASFDLARFCNTRAISLTANRKFDQAEKLYSNTIEIMGSSSDVYKVLFNLGLCMKKSGKMQMALKYFSQCQESAPLNFTRVKEQIAFLQKRKSA